MIYSDITFTALLLMIAIIDTKTRLIPNRVLLIVGIVILPFVISAESLILGVIGLGVGFGVFLSLYLIAPTKVGAGDVKLAGLIGLMTGFPLVLLSLLLTSLLGGIVSIVLVATKRVKISGSIPYAPFLCGGAVISLWAGDWIFNWYLGLF